LAVVPNKFSAYKRFRYRLQGFALKPFWCGNTVRFYSSLFPILALTKVDVEKRRKNPEGPRFLRANADKTFAEGLGIHSTPTFILFVAGQQPISANQRTLPNLLNSATVQALLAVKQTKGLEISKH
jgi:hypothetical protein